MYILISRMPSCTSEHEQTAGDICVFISTRNAKHVCDLSSTDSAILVFTDVHGCDKLVTVMFYARFCVLFHLST